MPTSQASGVRLWASETITADLPGLVVASTYMHERAPSSYATCLRSIPVLAAQPCSGGGQAAWLHRARGDRTPCTVPGCCALWPAHPTRP